MHNTLENDLSQAMDEYSPQTDAEKKFYPKPLRGKRLTHQMFSKDTKKRIMRLLEEDGWDGQPVGSLSAKSAERFFYYDDNHIFPPIRDLVRFGIFMHWDLVRITALVLKGEWEFQFAKFYHYSTGGKKSLLDLLQNAKTVESFRTFKPDIDTIFDCLEEHGKLASSERYDKEKFRLVVSEILMNNLHHIPLGSNMVQLFKDKLNKEVLGIPEDEKERFLSLKMEWIECHEEMTDKLYEIQNLELEDTHTYNHYLAQFGKEYQTMFEQDERVLNLQYQVNLKENDKTLTKEQLKNKSDPWLLKSQHKIKELNANIAMTNRLKLLPGDGSIDCEQIEEEQRMEKRVLRDIYMLTYPDRLEQNPVYNQLTEGQKKQLKDYFQTALKYRPSEMGYHPEQYGWDHRSYLVLSRILDHIKTILSSAGIEINPDTVIQGDTCAEKIKWFEREIEFLKKEIHLLDQRIIQIGNNAELLTMRSQLAQVERYDYFREELQKQAKMNKLEADRLEARLDELFKE